MTHFGFAMAAAHLIALSNVSAASVPEARLNPAPVQLPVVDGKGMRFTRISPAEGLSQTRAAQIIQDDRGFMWFGTQYGLNRYDGYRFKVFAHDPQRPGSLGCAFIHALLKDRSGMLWIGCDQSLDRFDPSTEEFTHYKMESGDSKVPVGVFHISQDRAGMMWLATGTGLYRFDPRTEEARHFRHNPADAFSLNSNYIEWTGEDTAGTFWVGTDKGLDAFDRHTGKVTFHIPVEGAVGVSFYEDRFGLFWILSASHNGLAVLDRKTSVLTRYSFYERGPAGETLSAVRGMVEDREGNLWLGSPDVGILRFDRAGRRFVGYRNNPSDPESPAEDKVIRLYEDSEGNIWTGLNSKPPNHFNPAPPIFEQFRHQPGNPDSLDIDFVNAIYEDHEGVLWIGNDNALVRVDRKTGHYKSFTAGLGKKPMVISILEDGSGILWLGTYGHGLTRFEPRTGLARNYRHNPADPSSLSNDQVHRVFIDHAGSLWALTNDGLNRFEPSTGNFKAYKSDWRNRNTENYVAITEEPHGTFWLSTLNSGLYHFDPESGRFTRYQADPNNRRSLRDNMVSGVEFDGPGALWVATFGGINRLDLSTGTFTSLDERDGLSGNAISCMLRDARGKLWMSTNRGISSFDPQARKFRNYSAADGLPGNDLTGWDACFKSSSGEMFFGGFSGAVAFRPEKLTDSSYAPMLSLTDLRLSGSPVGVGGSSPLRKSISYTNRLRLSRDQSAFSVTFSAPSYFSPGENRYRYKLEGLDKTWHEVGSDERLAAYTTLPAGKYIFRAQAATRRGPWGAPGVALEVEILPRLWETAWFQTICCGFMVLSLWGLYRLRLRQIAFQFDVRLEERVGERTRIARELHDSLLQSFHGLMLRFQLVKKMLPDRPGEAERALKIAIDRAAQAITEGRDAVQALRTSTTSSNELIPGLTALGEEMAAIYADPESGQDTVVFRLLVEGTPEALHPILQDELFRIAREAIGNAFRHARAKHIEVDIRFDGRVLQLRVRDDGIGIESSIATNGREGHWGLAGMRERARNIGARFEVWSQAGAGTEIEIIVPEIIAYRADHGAAASSNGTRDHI